MLRVRACSSTGGIYRAPRPGPNPASEPLTQASSVAAGTSEPAQGAAETSEAQQAAESQHAAARAGAALHSSVGALPHVGRIVSGQPVAWEKRLNVVPRVVVPWAHA